jgi:hypothetical protein
VRDVKVEIKGIQEVNAALRAYGKDLGASLALIMKATASQALTGVRNSITQGPKTGHVYYRIPGDKVMTVRRGAEDGPIVAVFNASGKQNLSLRHQSSAPGQAPANDTGSLLRSLYFHETGTSFKIGSPLPYSRYLEFGTRKIEMRPAWVPNVEKRIPIMLKNIKIAIAKAKSRAEKTTK